MKLASKLISISILVGLVLNGLAIPAKAAIDAPRGVSFIRVDGSKQLKLAWVNPTQTDLARIDIYISYYEAQLYGTHPVTDPAQLVPGQRGEYTFSGLVDYQNYYFYLKAVDSGGNSSNRTDIYKRNTALFTETTSPGPITSLGIATRQGALSLSWTNPADADFYRANIYRGLASDFVPEAGNRVGQIAGLPSASATFENTNLPAQTTYYYKIISEDVIGNPGEAASISATTPVAPVVVPDEGSTDPSTEPGSTSDLPPSVLPDPKQFDYQAAWVSQSGQVSADGAAHVVMAHPGDVLELTLTLKNTGRAWWYVDMPNGAHKIKLGTWQPADRSSQLQDVSWVSNNRAAKLLSVVPTGSSYNFKLMLKVPASAASGTVYREYFRPVAEYVEWFGPTGVFWDIKVI